MKIPKVKSIEIPPVKSTKSLNVAALAVGVLAVSLEAGLFAAEERFDDPAVIARLNQEAGPAVPTVKKLSPAWIKDLPRRGDPQVYTRENSADFAYLGMPVGGIGCGQLYLAGDGKLWWWDIFNTLVPQTDFPNEQGVAFMNPPRADDALLKNAIYLEQGFGLKVVSKTKTWERTLDRDGFKQISFAGTYPVATVSYRDDQLPVEVEMRAFSPFIPLDLPNSSLPATILRFTVKNHSNDGVEVSLAGWLQNGVMTGDPASIPRLRNTVVAGNNLHFLNCSMEAPSDAAAKASAHGTMGLALLGKAPEISLDTIPGRPFASEAPATAVSFNSGAPVGEIGRSLALAPGASATVDFVLTWNFPNLTMPKIGKGREYSKRFQSAQDVAQYVSDHFEKLTGDTELWAKSWNDATLPHWFLDRVFGAVCGLATSTSYRMADGRFYAYEGVYACPGTCTHVYHYNQAISRLFPAIERDLRERVDLGVGFNSQSGVIGFRAEYDGSLAVDGQAGTLLRMYREHLMSPDNTFLLRNWPRIKQAYNPLFQLDPDGDGIMEGPQANTLDCAWFGQISWLSGLYVAAVRAGEEMAAVCGDTEFAARCHRIAQSGYQAIPAKLFQDGYFINRVDPSKPESINTGSGCELDQVFGQGWAFQVGLPRVLPAQETRAALRSIWKYNFTSDVAPFRAVNKPGRWYAAPGEGGLILCTFPRSDWTFEQAKGKGPEWATGYFNECQSGYEHEVISHMMWEEMAPEALAAERAIADRYHGAKRNPWNEVENGSHYGRAMASYGVYIAACGYEYNGPKGYIAFAPRLTPDQFQAAFTAAQGWGSFSQEKKDNALQASLLVRWGMLRLKTLGLAQAAGVAGKTVQASVDGKTVAAALSLAGNQWRVEFKDDLTMQANQRLTVIIR
jgi:uncharacterized protein (DUF608 family)